MMSQWQKDWQKAESLFNDINQALDDGQWDRVKDYQKNPDKLPDIKYWRNRIEPLLKQAADNIAEEEASPQTTPDKKPNLIERLLQIRSPKSKTTEDKSKNTGE